MSNMTFIRATSLDQALEAASQNSNAIFLAGGTDLCGCLHDKVWPQKPQAVIDLQAIPDLHGICSQKDEDGQAYISLGALTSLADLETSSDIRTHFNALADAARHTASPLLRNQGTLAGNICQENRCWYYRLPNRHGQVAPCARKGGSRCMAIINGDTRYHSIFGAVERCFAVNPSDTAPALMVFEAVIETNKRNIPIEEFFNATQGKQSTILGKNELVLRIRLPLSCADTHEPELSQSCFVKSALRKSIDFAIANCAARIVTDSEGVVRKATIALNSVFNIPLRVKTAEQSLCGIKITDQSIEDAADLAFADAKPLKDGSFKMDVAKAVLKKCLFSCVSQSVLAPE